MIKFWRIEGYRNAMCAGQQVEAAGRPTVCEEMGSSLRPTMPTKPAQTARNLELIGFIRLHICI